MDVKRCARIWDGELGRCIDCVDFRIVYKNYYLIYLDKKLLILFNNIYLHL